MRVVMGEGHVLVRMRMWFLKSSLSVMPVVVMRFVMMDVVMFFSFMGVSMSVVRTDK